MKSVRIGNGCGFWGDNLDAPIVLVEKGDLHYLTLDYLAELTMSILALQKQRDPSAGYAADFLDVLERLAPLLNNQPNLKIITNAGGMNPQGCAARARDILDKTGLAARRIAVVSGDDLLPRLDDLMKAGWPFANLDSGEPLSSVRGRVVSANAYLGARPLAEALGRGASVVISGRVADASLTLGPAVHEFGWAWDDWDRLAGATTAGHLIECGAQATGGMWCNWQEAVDLAAVGYPIAEINEDGSFLLTKPPGTGGAVNRETVAEQLLYEVGDPAAYLTPDVVADFTTVRIAERGRDVVHIGSAAGKSATDTYKVSIAYRDGWSAGGALVVAGPAVVEKARRCGEIVRERLRSAGADPHHFYVEAIGAGACLPRASAIDPPEVTLRVAVRDARRHIVERFAKELAPLVTSGPPGVTGYTTGRPAVREVFAYWPALVPKNAVVSQVQLLGEE
jgi:hypothetical protein